MNVTPLAYLFALQGFIWGVAFTFFQDLDGVRNTVLYKQSALIGVSFWGAVAVIASLVLIGGMTVEQKVPTMVGAAGMWVLWVFALIVYVSDNYWFLFTLAVLNVLMYGYLYLAASLGMLWVDTDEQAC